MCGPLESSAEVMDLFDSEVEKMDDDNDIVFFGASVIADVLSAVSCDAEDRAVILAMAAELFAVRHERDPSRGRMH